MSEIPGWISDDYNERRKRISAKLKESGSAFFAAVVSRLELNAAHLGKVGVRGQVSYLSRPGERELRCRLDVRVNGSSPCITYTDLFHMSGTMKVLCRPREGDSADFQLCLLDSKEVGVIADGEFVQMAAEEFADWVVKTAVARLREAA